MKKGSKHSKETQEKMRISAAKRISPPHTEDHKRKIRETNIKTWSNLELLKRHGELMKIVLRNMPIERKIQQIIKSRISCSKPEIVAKRREVMLKLRSDPEWIRKSNEGKKGRIGSFKGKHHTIESRIKNSLTKKNSPLTPRGPKNPAWIDGRGNLRKNERVVFQQTLEYRLFREAVFKRDNWTCVLCKERGGKLSVDHIKSYREYPELRIDINNGRTLCWECHKKTPNFGRKKNYAKSL